MSSSALESLRVLHEDIEQTEAAVSILLQSKYEPHTLSMSTAIVTASSITPPASTVGHTNMAPINPPYNISPSMYYDICVSYLLSLASKSANSALEYYGDQDASRKEEIAFLAGGAAGDDGSSGDVWTNFYDRIKMVKDYHRKFGTQLNALTSSGTSSLAVTRTAGNIVHHVKNNFNDEVVDSHYFTEEERGGRRIDMLDLYSRFVNITSIKHFKEERHKLAEKARIRKKLAAVAMKTAAVSAAVKKDGEDDSVLADGEGNDGGEQGSSSSGGVNISDAAVEALTEEYRECDYITYLRTFDLFSDIPRTCKYRNTEYIKYLDSLLDKLQTFFRKTHPLAPLEKMQSRFEEEFGAQWRAGQVPSWQDPPSHQDPLYAMYTDKLFSSEGQYKSHIGGKKYKKLEDKSQTEHGLDHHSMLVERSLQHDKELAYKEFVVAKYHMVLKQFFHNTICHLQKKQSRSARELEAEDEEEEGGGEGGGFEEEEEEECSDDDDEDKPIYNPLSLPLGWDGKPIPFWLYKLHGLGVEYKCEICGNYSYWGRKAFEKHFQEWRHAMGMRCLKIPNTTHFKEITKIEDAITLYEKLKKGAEAGAFKFDQEVECEDSQGNVMSARAYEDMRRQGLL
eukprot:GHVQ01043481.1.p1 GENE.GHVQ01043481.1~~GHVQ01043481.1.p1  ORF type:complete len:622 (-),score=125.53 GHVQ01043481.1:401-2266(-)